MCPRDTPWPYGFRTVLFDVPLSFALVPPTIYEDRMNASNLVDLVKGLAAGMEGGGKGGPYRVTVPHGTNLGEFEEGENVSLESRLKDIEGVKEVVVGQGPGASIVQCLERT